MNQERIRYIILSYFTVMILILFVEDLQACIFARILLCNNLVIMIRAHRAAENDATCRLVVVLSKVGGRLILPVGLILWHRLVRLTEYWEDSDAVYISFYLLMNNSSWNSLYEPSVYVVYKNIADEKESFLSLTVYMIKTNFLYCHFAHKFYCSI